MTFTDWIPLLIRWTLVLLVVIAWSWQTSRRLNFRAWPDRSRPIEVAILAYCLGVLLLTVVEAVVAVIFFKSGRELLPWLRIVFGYNPAGWVADALLVLPVFWIRHQERHHVGAPLLAVEARLEALRRDPELAFSRDGIEVLLRDLSILARRFPQRLQSRLEELRRQCLEIAAKPPPAVCLKRSVEALKRGSSPDALVWLKRWDDNALETLLVRLEHLVWRDSLAHAAKLPAELQEELLQLAAELPQDTGIRSEARALMKGTRTLRRRRAVLEFHGGATDSANQTLEGDWEATNWLRAAAAQSTAKPTADPASS
jgi:hypothetical protein